jgi:hypothetical protein
MLMHQISGKLGGALNGGRAAVTSIFTHLNTDRVIIPRTIEIRVLTLFIGRKMLHSPVLISGKVPNKVANTITPSTFGSA